MTIENCIRLLGIYKKNGGILTGARKIQSKKNFEMMKTHILSCKKFKDHPILKELTAKPKVEKPVEVTKPKTK